MARSFNGTSDKIAADAAHVATLGAFTVAAWVKAAGSATNADWYSEGSATTNNPFVQLQVNSGKFRVFIRSDSNAGTSEVNGTTSALTCADGTWHHLLFAQGSGSGFGPYPYQAYIDGVADSTLGGTWTSTSLTLTPNTVCIGALRRSSVSNFFPGTIAHVATWKRQLLTNEAKGLSAGISPLLYGPDHYWPLFGADSPEPDLGTGTHVTGTLTGTAFAPGKDPASLLDFAGATVGV